MKEIQGQEWSDAEGDGFDTFQPLIRNRPRLRMAKLQRPLIDRIVRISFAIGDGLLIVRSHPLSRLPFPGKFRTSSHPP